MTSTAKINEKLIRRSPAATLSILADAEDTPKWTMPMPKIKPKAKPTQQQKNAIAAALQLEPGQSLAIKANAGCGKTALVKMLADELEEGRITITAFSDKAVNEIRSRIRTDDRRVSIKTFHGLCLSVLNASGFDLELECTDAERKVNPRNAFKKSNRLQEYGMRIFRKSETINSRYLRTITFIGWDLKSYAEGAVNRNGYSKSNGISATSIIDTEITAEKKIGLSDRRNREAYIQLIKQELIETLKEIVVDIIDQKGEVDCGLEKPQILRFNDELKKNKIGIKPARDVAFVIDTLMKYLSDPTCLEKGFSVDKFLEYYDTTLQEVGYFNALDSIGVHFVSQQLCHGSILGDSDVLEFFEEVEDLINLKDAEERIYKTVAYLATEYVNKGLEIARKENVITYYEMLLLCKLWPVEEYMTRYLIVDEAQDFSPLIHSVLSTFVSDYTSLIVVGDPNQAIFQWAGAEKDSYGRLIDQFDCKVYPLSKSFRCGKAIIEYAQQYVPEIEHGNSNTGCVVVTDEPFFEGDYLPGDLILGRTRLDVGKAYFEYLSSTDECDRIRCYSKGLDILSAVKKVSRLCTDSGTPIEEIYQFTCKEVTSLHKRLSKGAKGIRDEIELFSIVKMAIAGLSRKDKFYSSDDLFKLIEKAYPTYKRLPEDDECVRFLTVHQAKGSEADRAIVIDAEKFYSPVVDECEEKRLSYVMITRARHDLILCGGHPCGGKSKEN